MQFPQNLPCLQMQYTGPKETLNTKLKTVIKYMAEYVRMSVHVHDIEIKPSSCMMWLWYTEKLQSPKQGSYNNQKACYRGKCEILSDWPYMVCPTTSEKR